MTQAKNTKHIPLLITTAVLTVILTTITTYYISSRETPPPPTEASPSNIELLEFKPDQIIEGETETALITGRNLEETCVAFLDEKPINSSFINTESIEIEIPETIEEGKVTVKCPEGEDEIQLEVVPKLEELP